MSCQNKNIHVPLHPIISHQSVDESSIMKKKPEILHLSDEEEESLNIRTPVSSKHPIPESIVESSPFQTTSGFSLFGGLGENKKSSPWTRSAEIKTPQKAVPFDMHYGFPSLLGEESFETLSDFPDLSFMELEQTPVKTKENAPPQQSSTFNPNAPVFVPKPVEKDFPKIHININQSSDALVEEFTAKIKDLEDYGKCTRYADAYLAVLSKGFTWKIYLDMAEKAKKLGELSDASSWYSKATLAKPYNAQGWLDASKLEEDCGRMEDCRRILLSGLNYCPQNESLLIKGLKFFEAQGQLSMARSLLSKVKQIPIEKSWKIILEGAQMEARAGHLESCQRLFEYLMREAPSHGPIYSESFKMEYNYENYDKALTVVETGLTHLPKYGPLWFCLFMLYEKMEKNIAECIEKSIGSISKELIWKVYFEYAQMKERRDDVEGAREAYVQSAIHSIPTLRWKVWLAGSRLELNQGKMSTSMYLLNRALEEVPNKTRASVLIECARMEEYQGRMDEARNFIKRAQREAKHEWKVFLEGILLEMRNGHLRNAIVEAREALKIHKRTGRLWAMLIQLLYIEGEDAQMEVFHEALLEVPKSGEVWCEGARIRMNPLYAKFDLEKARKYLKFAINFTPQYGDSFIEYLKLQLLTKGSFSEKKWIRFEQRCIHADPNYGPLWFHCKKSPLDSTRIILQKAKQLLLFDLASHRNVYQERIISNEIVQSDDSPLPYLTGLPYLCILLGTYKMEEFARRRLIFGLSDHVL